MLKFRVSEGRILWNNLHCFWIYHKSVLHTWVVFFLHLSDAANMFSWVPPFGRGHWSMSTRRKSMSIPLVPLEIEKRLYWDYSFTSVVAIRICSFSPSEKFNMGACNTQKSRLISKSPIQRVSPNRDITVTENTFDGYLYKSYQWDRLNIKIQKLYWAVIVSNKNDTYWPLRSRSVITNLSKSLVRFPGMIYSDIFQNNCPSYHWMDISSVYSTI